MHEMSVALAVVEQVEEASCADAAPVSLVRLRIGELAGVVPESLRFCFELACTGTVLAGATLTIDHIPARARCGSCAGEWATGVPPHLWCTACDTGREVALVAGRELGIAAVHREPAASCAPVHPAPYCAVPEES